MTTLIELPTKDQEVPAPPYTPRDTGNIQTTPNVYGQQQQPVYGQGGDNAQYVIPLESLGDQPDWVDCPYCKKRVKTRVQTESSGTTIMAGVLLGLCCICLACIPCATGFAENVDHWCGQCNKHLTTRHHDQQMKVVPEADRLRRPAGAPRPDQVPSQYANPQPEVSQPQPVATYPGTPQPAPPHP